MKNQYNYGDIVMVNLPCAHTHVQGKLRPCIVLGNELALRYSPVITVLPLTGKVGKKMNLPCHVVIGPDETNNSLRKNSVVLAEQITTVPKEWIVDKCGCVESSFMNMVINAVKAQLIG